MPYDKKQDLFSYVYHKCYPGQTPITDRLQKIVYLCDWYSSIHRGRPITDIDWRVEITGIEGDFRPTGVFAANDAYTLPGEELKMVDEVIKRFNLKNAGIEKLKPLVNSTYPAFLQQPIGSSLRLGEIACMYRQIESDKRWNDKTITDQETNSMDAIDK